jgi:hypothetical protein
MTDARAVLHALSSEPQTKAAIALSLDWYSKKGQPDTRRVEQAVLSARLEGQPIASGDGGYWKAQTSAELLPLAPRQVPGAAQDGLGGQEGCAADAGG